MATKCIYCGADHDLSESDIIPKSCLDLADENGLKSIAFCCISTGVFMFPNQRAAEIAVQTVKEWLDQHEGNSVEKIIFNVYKDQDLEIYDKLLN